MYSHYSLLFLRISAFVGVLCVHTSTSTAPDFDIFLHFSDSQEPRFFAGFSTIALESAPVLMTLG